MERPKKGFAIPIDIWFKNELKEYFVSYLSGETIKHQNFFSVKEVVKLRDNYLKGNKENVQKLWFLLMFQMWYEKIGN
jgi:asparagine synthase (glutamine-hydrolysing)